MSCPVTLDVDRGGILQVQFNFLLLRTLTKWRCIGIDWFASNLTHGYKLKNWSRTSTF